MRLTERLRDALQSEPAAPPLVGDLQHDEITTELPAAVLVGITDRAEPGLILTVRRENMRTHAGQIAFPGGKIDPGEDAVGAALREAWEELGLDPAATEVVTETDSYRTVTGYVVTPVVAVVRPDQHLRPHEFEVADWFEAPLHFVLDPVNQQLKSALFRERERHYYEIVWNDRRIWGATAAMIVNLSRRLRWS